MIRLLFVCLGNICRSPLAEGLVKHHAEKQGILDRLEIDSAGTGAWHIGNPPDQRSIAVAKKHGLDISGQRARKIKVEDFDLYDYLFAMDNSNLNDLISLSPHEHHGKIRLFTHYDDSQKGQEVPDPYYNDGFDGVYAMVDHAAEQLILHLKETHFGDGYT